MPTRPPPGCRGDFQCPWCGIRLPTHRGVRTHYTLKLSCARRRAKEWGKLKEKIKAAVLASKRKPKRKHKNRTTPEFKRRKKRQLKSNSGQGHTLAAEPNADDGSSSRPPPEQPAEGDTLHAAAHTASKSDSKRTLFRTPACKPSHPSIFVEQHPDLTSGGVLRWERHQDQPQSPYDPMWKNEIIFKRGAWLGNVHVSNEDRNSFLAQENTGVPWRNVREFFRDVDRLPHGPAWRTSHLKLPSGAIVGLYHRDAVELVRILIQTRRFNKHMRYAPVREWASKDRRKRFYGEMWTAQWWWRIQNALGRGRGATIAPVILSCDKTQLSRMSGNRQAWPVYLTIGNISKNLRRRPSEHAMILLGYVPVTDLTGNEESQFFHDCVKIMVESMIDAGKTGIEMFCADGGIRIVFPILAAFIADFAEQTLVACAIRSRCPICLVPESERGNMDEEYNHRNLEDLLPAWQSLEDGDGSPLDDLGLHHVLPFWRNLPFADISTSITPDLLHQLHRGMTGDHLVKWMTRLVGKDRFDRWLTGLPRASGVRHFTKGKSPITQWTGKESKQLAKVFMSIVAGCDEPEAVKAARHLLDFTYRAHLPQLSDDDLTEMEADLLVFHELKDIFRTSGAYQAPAGFKGIPKLHMLSHYVHSIRQLGSPDNFNTETTERLHIEYVKDGWRASNHVNEIPQMTRYLQRRESWVLLRIYLADIGVLPIDEDSVTPDDNPYEKQDGPILENKSLVEDGGEYETVVNPNKRKRGSEDESGQSSRVKSNWADDLVWHPRPKVSTAKRAVQCSGSQLINIYGATHLIEATRDFLCARTGTKSLHPLQGRHRFYVWPRCKLEHGVVPFTPSDGAHTEVIRATPKLTDSLGRQTRYAAFDTALFSSSPDVQGLHRYVAGRVRAIFKLPAHLQHLYSKKLVYIEHFHPFSAKPHPVHGLYTTSRRMERDQPRVRYSSVMPLSKIQMACHLTPIYSREEPTDSISATSDLLSDYRRFYLNSYSSYFMFNVLNRWRKQLSVR
ncbi:hypothetical protein RhiJN_25117 [Ceratobasidium sp. AG-Ba]|nr:hypothetical protein RhiJN_25117 [Ceratobasidium sp. AG-Ba]